MTKHSKRSPLNRVVGLVSAGFVVAAVARELSLPADERTWHGEIAHVPYDFRLPTLKKLQAHIWAPEDPHVLTPHVFGVGWTVNVGRVVALLTGAAKSSTA